MYIGEKFKGDKKVKTKLADELWDIFRIFPGDNYLRDNFSYSQFEQQHSMPVLTIAGIANLSLGWHYPRDKLIFSSNNRVLKG